MDSATRRTIARRAARDLSRALEAIDDAVWVINSDHELIFISGPAADWLETTAEELIGRKCHVAAERTSPHDELVAALAPPLGLHPGCAIVAVVQPPGIEARTIRYAKLGQGTAQIILAVSGAVEPPADDDELELAKQVRERLNQWRRQNASLGLIAAAGTSSHAVRLRQQIALASATRQSLCIVGPRGSGGEVIARRIHAAMAGLDAKAEPIITVDTPLMDAELLEATLSPAAAHLNTDAHRTATLLLRSVDESPLDVQQRIIDFASQYGANIRLIGLLAARPFPPAQSQTLTAQMAIIFSVFEISIAPLAIRCEDVSVIAAALVDSRNAAGACVAERISRAAQDQLLLYPWPGNFDELEASIRHATSVCRSAVIQREDLPLAVRSFALNPPKHARAVVETTLDEAMKDFELEKIREALDVADGNRSEAARLLGISRGRLLRRLDEPTAKEIEAPDQAPP
jgi:DNA-binding NtrC family response regulator